MKRYVRTWLTGLRTYVQWLLCAHLSFSLFNNLLTELIILFIYWFMYSLISWLIFLFFHFFIFLFFIFYFFIFLSRKIFSLQIISIALTDLSLNNHTLPSTAVHTTLLDLCFNASAEHAALRYFSRMVLGSRFLQKRSGTFTTYIRWLSI